MARKDERVFPWDITEDYAEKQEQEDTLPEPAGGSNSKLKMPETHTEGGKE